MDKTMFFRILNSEMELATGCTEPGAVALTGAYAGAELNKRGEVIRRMEVNASTNILKNAMAAGIPGTKYTGMGYASAIGACAAAPEKQLEVINGVSDDVYKAAELLVESGKVVVGHADVPQKLYIEVIAHGDTHTARAVIADLHTNLIALEVDGESVMTAGGSAAGGSDKDVVTPEEIAEFLTLRKIYDFCDKELDPMNDPIDIIRSAVSVNSAICERGLEKDYGLAIGPNLRRNCHDGLMTWDMVTNSMMVTAAGADARMAGAPYSVVANSGSGNQGITVSVPLIVYARHLGSSDEQLYRALVLSNLVAIHQKTGIGRLSAFCGAVCAGAAAGAGIAYLDGGGYCEACHAVVNALSIVAGMVCDGAKPSCAGKIAFSVNAGILGYVMYRDGQQFYGGDGIVKKGVENTIDSIARLGRDGMRATNDEIIRIMLGA